MIAEPAAHSCLQAETKLCGKTRKLKRTLKLLCMRCGPQLIAQFPLEVDSSQTFQALFLLFEKIEWSADGENVLLR